MWREVVPTRSTEKTILGRDYRFFATLLSVIIMVWVMLIKGNRKFFFLKNHEICGKIYRLIRLVSQWSRNLEKTNYKSPRSKSNKPFQFLGGC